MKRKYFKLGILGLILILVSSIIFTSCTSGGTSTPTTNAPSLLDQIKANTGQIETLVKSNANLDVRLATVENNQVKTDSNLSKLTNQVSGLGSYENFATKSELTNQINNLQNNINQQLSNQVTTLQNKINEDGQTIKTLTDRIVKLETAQTSSNTTTNNSSNNGSVSSENIIVQVKDLGTEILEGDYDFSGGDSIKITITNKNATSVTDLRLKLYMETQDNTLSKKYIQDEVTLSGDTTCTLTASSSDSFEFKTGRITVGANKTKTFYLTPAITLKPEYPYLIQDAGGIYTVSGKSGKWSLSKTAGDVLGTDYVENTYKYGDSILTEDITYDETIEIIDFNVE